MVILLVCNAFNGWLQAESPVSAMAVVIMTIDDAIKTHHGQFSIINHSNIIVLSFNLIINHGKSWQSWKQFIQKFLIKQQMMMMSVWMLLQQQRSTAARQMAASLDHSLLQWRNWWYARHTSRPLKIPFMEASRRLHSWLTTESRRTRRKMMHAMQWSHHCSVSVAIVVYPEHTGSSIHQLFTKNIACGHKNIAVVKQVHLFYGQNVAWFVIFITHTVCCFDCSLQGEVTKMMPCSMHGLVKLRRKRTARSFTSSHACYFFSW